MKIESLEIHNFKVFRDVKIGNITNLAVFVGKNGVGKTTFFDVFGFLHDCLSGNIRSALAKRGSFKEVISRNAEGDIRFIIKFRAEGIDPLITYEVSIGLDNGMPVVKREILRMRRGQYGAPWKVLDFACGKGVAASGILNNYKDVRLSEREEQKLDSPDILAIKGLGQFKEFEVVAAFRRLIEDWYVSDFKIDYARVRREADSDEQISRSGDNLATVTKFIRETQPKNFADILTKMKNRVPGISKVEAQETEDGYVVLRFQDGAFLNPFSAKYVSDGTIKMFSYLVLLNEPQKHALLCVEEPENQLYPELLSGLAEEFRDYAENGGQVFISTHSPDFLNAINLSEIFILVKENGFTTIKRAEEIDLLKGLYDAGDFPGALWQQGLFAEK